MKAGEWDLKTGLARAQAYCAGAEHCNSEVRAMLVRHGLSESQVVQILALLVADGFIDELRYARAFVNDKMRFDRWGRRKIAMALKLKHIAPEVADTAIAEMDMDAYMDVLGQVVKSCSRQAKAPTPYARNMKILRSVASRGFEPELAQEFLRSSDDCVMTEHFDETI